MVGSHKTKQQKEKTPLYGLSGKIGVDWRIAAPDYREKEACMSGSSGEEAACLLVPTNVDRGINSHYQQISIILRGYCGRTGIVRTGTTFSLRMKEYEL